MTKKFAVSVLLLLLMASVLVVYAGMHFVGTTRFGSGPIEVQGSIFDDGVPDGTPGNPAIPAGYLFQEVIIQSAAPMTAVCQNAAGNQVIGSKLVTVNKARHKVVPFTNNQARVNFTIAVKPRWNVAGCPDSSYSVTELFGTLNVTLVGQTATRSINANFVCTATPQNPSVTCPQV